MDEIGRRHPTHGVRIDLGLPTIVFLTVCTKGREPWLACEEAQTKLVQAWQEAEAWRVGRYVLMPDHLHLFCAPQAREVSLEPWVRFWKSRFRRLTPEMNWCWQSHHWDRRLRWEESYVEKWEYVRRNPLRAGLVDEGIAWPYEGELHLLDW